MDPSHPIPELDHKGLRSFALTTGAIVAVLFGLFFPWVLDRAFPVWPWGVFALLALWGLIAPGSIRPVYLGWMRLGLLLGRITTPVVMTALYVLAIVPVALIMRAVRHDPMRRHIDKAAASYRVPRPKAPPGDLERPF